VDWEGTGVDADFSGSTFDTIKFWKHASNTDTKMIFDFEQDSGVNYIGAMNFDDSVFSNIDCYECGADNTLIYASGRGYSFDSISILNINTNVYADGSTADNRMFEHTLRRPYNGGADIETFAVTGASVSNYQSGGRIWTVEFDSSETQTTPASYQIIFAEDVTGTVAGSFSDITVEDEGGAVFYMDDAREMWFQCDNVAFDNIESNGFGGVFRADNLLKVDASQCDATDVYAGVAGTKGRFFYSEVSIVGDIDVTLATSTVQCDTAGDFSTVQALVDSGT